MRGKHRSFPKPLPRLESRLERDRAFDRAWHALCRIVDARDRYRCRVCQRRVVHTLTLCAERLERHHLASRAQAPRLTLEPRNVICVCASCHGKLTRHELAVTGTESFECHGQVYLNADCALTFLPSDPCTPSIESELLAPQKDQPHD